MPIPSAQCWLKYFKVLQTINEKRKNWGMGIVCHRHLCRLITAVNAFRRCRWINVVHNEMYISQRNSASTYDMGCGPSNVCGSFCPFIYDRTTYGG